MQRIDCQWPEAGMRWRMEERSERSQNVKKKKKEKANTATS